MSCLDAIADSTGEVHSSKTDDELTKWIGDEYSNAAYIKVKSLGGGAHGDAQLVKNVKKGGFAVAKVFSMHSMSVRDVKYACSEIRCLSLLKHPNVVRYLDDVRTDKTLLILMEYAEGGDLEKQIQGRRDMKERFKEHEISFIFAQICSAVSAIHSARMLHRDLKTANIFLTAQGIVKVGDFGYANIYSDTISNPVAGTFCGTPCYLAPELWEMVLYNKQAEVWSLGIVLYELLCLQKPFYSTNMNDLRSAIMHQTPPPVSSDQFSAALIDICRMMLDKHPGTRISLSSLMLKEYLQQAFASLLRVVRKKTNLPERDELLASISLHVTSPEWDPEGIRSPTTSMAPKLQQAVVTPAGEVEWYDCTVEEDAGVKITCQGNTVVYSSDIVNACPISQKEVGTGAVLGVFFSNRPPIWLRATSTASMHATLDLVHKIVGL